MKTVTVPNDLVEALLAYLWSRPMSEAYELFNRLSTCVQEQAQGTNQAPHTAAPTGGLMHRDQLLNQ